MNRLRSVTRLDGRCKSALQAVEAAVPAFVVLVAVLGVGELLVGDGDLGGFAVGGEVDGDEGVGRGAALPAPGVDEFAGRIDEAVGAEDGVDVAAFVSDGDAVLVADAEVDVGLGGVVVGGGEPLAELVGVGPRFEDAFDAMRDRCGRLRATWGMRRRLATCFVLLFFGIGLFEEICRDCRAGSPRRRGRGRASRRPAAWARR